MGSKTVDETGAETGAEATTEEKPVDITKTDEVTEADETTGADVDAEAEATDAEGDADAESTDEEVEAALAALAAEEQGPTGVGQGAGAVVSAALGIVSLTGSWVGTVGSAREALIGQIKTQNSSDIATIVSEGYVDGWNVNAAWGGGFALLALLVGVFVLIRPAFGAPGRPQAAWIKSVSWAGVALGVIGLLLAVLKITGIVLGDVATG